MPENHLTLLFLFARPADRQIMRDWLAGSDYELLNPTPEAVSPALWQKADLVLIDQEMARRWGEQLLAYKRQREGFWPLLLALSREDQAASWLETGFDDVVRLPTTKRELAARLRLFLYLRTKTAELLQRTRELADSEARYRQLVENPLVGIWLADSEARFLFINRRLAEMSGYQPEEVIGKMTMLDPIAPELRGWLAERLQKRRAGQLGPDLIEAEMVRKDGSRFTALVAPAALYDSQGNFTGYLGAMIDITDRKQLQQQLEEQIAQYRRLVQLMADREVRMSELKEVIRQLRAQLIAAGLKPTANDPLAL